jgi:hypothetical protein
MNKSIACVFPETLPDERLLFPLVQVFGQVVYMQPIENEPAAEQGTTAPFVELCQQSGRLRRFTPAPLGDQRERFLALVHDMQRRGVDYTRQLGMLTLAGLNRRDHPESKHSILSDLLKRSDIKEQEETNLLLWQSRLILKLGEFFDIEQVELNRALHEIANRQDALLAELCEEEDNPFVLPSSMRDAGQETDAILRHRLKAWSRLCFHNESTVPGLLITSHQAGMDLLQEVYEKLLPHSARKLVSLKLPCAQPASANVSSFAEPLGQQCHSLHMVLTVLASSVSKVQMEEGLEQLLKEGLTEWSQCLSHYFPSSRDEATCVLDLFFFPEISARQLCVESFNGGSLDGKKVEEEVSGGCVVGLLRID